MTNTNWDRAEVDERANRLNKLAKQHKAIILVLIINIKSFQFCFVYEQRGFTIDPTLKYTKMYVEMVAVVVLTLIADGFCLWLIV